MPPDHREPRWQSVRARAHTAGPVIPPGKPETTYDDLLTTVRRS
jgi:hypothetical protein